jgi:hypothetical protein
MLAKCKYRFVSGFGLVVGSGALSGVLDELNLQDTPNFERSLFLRPFPQIIPPGWDRQEYYRRYRIDLISQAGACIFIAGLKDEGGERMVANGVLAEFELAVANNRVPIPIGVTGGAAAEIWARVNIEYDRFYKAMSRSAFDNLNNPDASPASIVASTEEILEWIKKAM